MWDLQKLIIGPGYLAMVGNWTGKQSKCLFINVYGPQSRRLKQELWAQSNLLITEFTGVICIMSDFNVVRRFQERSGCSFKPTRVVDFNHFISDNELLEVKQGGRRFIWVRVNSDGLEQSKLDRLLVNK